MAVALDAISQSGQQSSATAFSFNHTCTGSNLVLIVVVGNHGNTKNLTGVTYNGVAMTLVRDDNGAQDNTHIYQLVNPATGTHSITVTVTDTTLTNVYAGGLSFTGVDQVSPIDANTGGTGTASAATNNITTVAANAMLVDVKYDNPNATGGSADTVNAAQTAKWITGPDAGWHTFDASIRLVTTATTYAMAWTDNASSPVWAHSLVSLKPFVAASTFVPRRPLMGVGF